MTNAGYVEKHKLAEHPLFGKTKPLLGHLDIELTERCNNACIHCSVNLAARDKDAERRELSTEQWKNVLHQAADLGALSVRLTGGEPLLRPDFAEIYLFARRLGLEVILFTNGRLITPELANLFARVPPLKNIEISVYGMHAESYEAVACAPGAFAEFRRGIDLLLARQVPFVVKSVLLPPNKAERDEFEAWAATIPWMDGPPRYAVFLDYRTRRDSDAKNRRISQLRLPPGEGVALAARYPDSYCRSMAQFAQSFMAPRGEELFTCGAGEGGCVDACGTYRMCMLLQHPDTVYDLRRGTLREALTEFFPRVRERRATNRDYLERCARCFLKGLCEQCPGKSWSEHGTLDTPVEYLCQVAHAQARYLGLLNEGELAWTIEDWQGRIQSLVNRVREQDEKGVGAIPVLPA